MKDNPDQWFSSCFWQISKEPGNYLIGDRGHHEVGFQQDSGETLNGHSRVL